jgi:uncharacterized protein (TIGR02996 family)
VGTVPRYEKTGAKGVEFVDVRIDRTTVRTTTGRAGAKPKSKQTKYASQRMADSRFAQAIAGAKKRGFAHVSSLRTPVVNAELEHVIATAPGDAAARAVYGDWLLAQGDPRGELIAVQHQLRTATGAKATTLRKRERALLADHSSVFYGVLDELLHLRTHVDRAHVRVVWDLGFFDEVELRLSEGGMPWFLSESQAVGVLTKLQSARFLRKLVLGSASNYAPSLKLVAALPATLRSLCVTGQLWGEYTPLDLRLGDLAAVCGAHPDLRQLELAMERDPLDGLALPNLEELDLWTNQLGKKQIDAVARAPWPKLRSLGIAVGSSASAKIADVATLLDARRFPALATLKLGRLPTEAVAAELGARLAKSVLGKQLETIVLVNTDGAVGKAFELAAGRPIASVERET